MKRIDFLKSLIVAPVAISQIDFSAPILDKKWLEDNLFSDESDIYCKFIKDSISVWDCWTGTTWEGFFIVFKKDCIEITTRLSSVEKVFVVSSFEQVKEKYDEWDNAKIEESTQQFLKYFRNHG